MHVEEGMPSVRHLITSHDSVLVQKSLQFCISDHVFIFVSFYFFIIPQIHIDSSDLLQSLFLCWYFTSNFYEFLFNINCLEDKLIFKVSVMLFGANETDSDIAGHLFHLFP